MLNLYFRLAPWLLAIIEVVLMAGAGLLIWRSRHQARVKVSALISSESAWGRFARRRKLSVFAVGAGVIVLRTALIPLLGVPQPRFHDEFSYLLAADTFAHGRVTNPPHPMWIHFETFHVIQQPTYMSLFPPAHGLVLAMGELLGRPWIGQLIITGAMCSALCWMLQAWMPPQWALLGGVIAALRLGLLSYWMNAYWSASVVALAGALVLGAWPRIRKHPSVAQSAIFALGLVILANSRPYEGVIFTIPVALTMVLWLCGSRRPLRGHALARLLLPMAIVLLMGGLATGWYYYKVTGSAFRMTYQVSSTQYGTAPYFLWQTPRALPDYRHAVMRDYYQDLLDEFNGNRTLGGFALRAAVKLANWWQIYLGPLMTVPLLAMPWVARERRLILPISICAVMAAALAVETRTLAHYFSPATGALYILLMQGLRHLWQWRRPAGIGPAIVRAVPLLACSMIALRVIAAAAHIPIEAPWPRGNLERAAILRQLDQMQGGQLVFVRYGPDHDVHQEWVWNQADIDHAKVVWARDMGEDANEELLRYFSKRRAWRINGDDSPPRLEQYSTGLTN